MYDDSNEKQPDDNVEDRVGLSALLSLQMLVQHVFVPTVRAVEAPDTEDGKSTRILSGLEDKLHKLDVALGQCRRTMLGTVPAVVLFKVEIK